MSVPRGRVSPPWPEFFDARIWFAFLLRRDARRDADTQDEDAQREFLAWWFVHGRREYVAGPPTPRQIDLLWSPVALQIGGAAMQAPRLMRVMLQGRDDVIQTASIGTEGWEERLHAWFIVYGLSEANLGDVIPASIRAHVTEPIESPPPRHRPPLTRLMRLAWVARPDVARKFPLDDDQGRGEFVFWFLRDGSRELPVRIWLGADQTSADCRRPPPAASRPARQKGVNLVGYAFGDLGIGEDLRMVARSLDAVDIPYSILDRSRYLKGSTGNRALADKVDNDCPYDTTLLCLTGFDAAEHFLTDGRGLDDRTVIGCWPWELPSWPAEWRAAYDLVDELWAASAFTAQAYAKDAPVPVMHLPSAVECQPAALSRAALDLPERHFLFLYVFDAHSFLQRKNPLAAVRAFQRAFPDASIPVGLVLKVMNAESLDPQWRAVQEAAASDVRIRIVAQTMSRGETLALIGLCDSYLSLHRAEGFGRTIAEAMLLGRPVIATGWSGSEELVTAQTALPVQAHLVPVQPSDYPWGGGSQWAEPDLDHAAWCLHRMIEDDALRGRLGLAGQAHVRARHHPRAVGERYAQRLLQRRTRPLG